MTLPIAICLWEIVRLATNGGSPQWEPVVLLTISCVCAVCGGSCMIPGSFQTHDMTVGASRDWSTDLLSASSSAGVSHGAACDWAIKLGNFYDLNSRTRERFLLRSLDRNTEGKWQSLSDIIHLVSTAINQWEGQRHAPIGEEVRMYSILIQSYHGYFGTPTHFESCCLACLA